MMPKPEGYVDVAERIVEFRTKHPEGSLSRVAPTGKVIPVEFITFGGKDWAVYTAFAYRTPDDTKPGVGTAWEPVPGPTNFTRDSEVQNAETSAWGRAMVAALAVDTKTIASADEVAARTGERIPEPVDEVLVQEWISAFADAPNLAALQEQWEGAGRAGVTGEPRVVSAKEARKKALA